MSLDQEASKVNLDRGGMKVQEASLVHLVQVSPGEQDRELSDDRPEEGVMEWDCSGLGCKSRR